LSPSNLVIADAEGPIALAGVIGGLHSAIGPDTKRIVLESANFQAASVRKTSVALKLRTDASMRFEKSQDPANTVRGLARALELLEQVSPGIRLVGGLADSHGELKTPAPIELTVDWLKAKLGRDLDAHEGALDSRIARIRRRRNRRRAISWSRCRVGAPPKTSRSRTTCWKKWAAWWATNPSRRGRR
jgi:phenylalanyl-tRNA synthetase beta subunit